MDKRRLLESIREDLHGKVGSSVHVRAHAGRRKTFEGDGVLEGTYPSIFVVVIDDGNWQRRVAYSYADVLTKVVEINTLEG